MTSVSIDKVKRAAGIILRHNIALTSLIKQYLQLSHGEVTFIMNELEFFKILGPNKGTKPRDIFIKNESEIESPLKIRNNEAI